MRYLIDTTVLVPYFAGDRVATDLLTRLAPAGFAVSILAYGGMPILPVSPATARRCAEIRSLLKKQGKSPRRRAFDLVIAATAVEHGLRLVAHNRQDYRDIPDLVLYDI